MNKKYTMNNPTQLTKPFVRAALCLAAMIVSGLATIQSSHAVMLHHWDFNSTNDSISGANVTLVGSATITNGSLNIPGGGVFVDYGSVNLANTLTTNATLTVECWYTQNALVNWSKVWMFGFDTANNEPTLAYIDYTPYTGLGGNVPKIDFDPSDTGELNAPGPSGSTLSAATQYHAVSVYDAGKNLMSMWINGALISSNNMGGESITNLGYNTARFGSGFFYGDPELNGSIADIRIYNHAVTPVEIAVNFASGPDAVPNTYVPTAVHLTLGNTNLLGGDTQQGDATADFTETGGTFTGLEVTAGVTNWSSSNPGVVTVSQSGLVTAVGAGNATVSAKVNGVVGSIAVSVAAVQPVINQDLTPLTAFVGSSVALTVGASGGNLTYYWYKNSVLVPSQTNSSFTFPSIALSDAGNYQVVVSNQVGTNISSLVAVTVLQQSLDHRYSMDDATVTDSIGGANGAPVNNVTFSGGQALFPGTNASGPNADYISLPAFLVSSYSSVTFEIWATIQPDGNWNQICSFGDQSGTTGNTYLAVIPHSGPGDSRMTIKTLGNERATSGAATLDTSSPVHIVAVYNADTSNELFYANGKLVSTRSTTIDISNLNNQDSWLGRSLFDGDAGMKGSIDEFRIWNGPLSPLQIAVNDGLGPNTINTNAGAFIALTNVSVTNATMVGGTSQQGTALANFANVLNVPFNSQVTNWSSGNTNVATVNASGVITAVGQGSAVISAVALGSTGTVTITVTAVKPTISQQPVPQTRFLGGSAQFSVVAAGGQLTYQWLKTGSPISNATNSVLALTGLANSDAADYSVTVSNPAGSTNSSVAHLTVSALPGGYAGTVLGDNPVAYWRLDETGGTNLIDSYNNNNGVYSGTETLGAPSLLFGGVGTAVTFAGGTATVPYSSTLNSNTFSVEFWAKPTTLSAAYVVALQDRTTGGRRGYAVQYDNVTSGWDFTLGTNNTLFATVSSGSPVSAATLYHVVATYDGTTASLYVNGSLTASAPLIYAAATPGSVSLTIATRNGNNPASATIDDVSVYGYALSSAQVASHYALGRSGTLAPAIVANPAPAPFKSVVGLPQTFTASVSGQAPLTVRWLKNGVPIPGANTPTLKLASLQLSDAGSYTLTASNSAGPVATSSAAVLTVVGRPFMIHRWSFNDNTDSISGSNVTLNGTASISGGQLVLAGSGHLTSYGTVNVSSDFAFSPSMTFEGWYTDNAALNWAKVWMFGISTANYIDYTPHRGDANHQASMSYNPSTGEVNTANLAFEPPVLTAGQTYHVVAAYDSVSNKMNLYLNGSLVATNNMKAGDLTAIQATQGLLGASLFGDPDLNGSVDEMRIWRGALTAGQVAATDFAGPNSVPDFDVSVAASVSSPGHLTFTWSSGTLQQAPTASGPWTPVAGASPPSFTVSTTGPMQFYRVQVQ